jgi:hypothetical protein
MSTRQLELKAEQLKVLGLKSGDVFQGSVQESGHVIVTVVHEDPTERRMTGKEFCEKWLGILAGPKPMTHQEMDDVRYEYLIAKHVHRKS